MLALRDVVRSAGWSIVRSVIDALDDVVFPPHCLITGRPLSRQTEVLPLVSAEGLDACEPAPYPVDLMLTVQRHIEADDIALSALHAIWGHAPTSDIGKLIYAVKYKGHKKLAFAMGQRLGRHVLADRAEEERFATTPLTIALVPVPIHRARKRERGYNQALLIAQGMAEVMKVPVWEALHRARNTSSQTTLSEAARLANVQDVFELAPHFDRALSKGASLLLVDDVLTTGATLNTCAWMLLNAGALRVEAATICATL